MIKVFYARFYAKDKNDKTPLEGKVLLLIID